MSKWYLSSLFNYKPLCLKCRKEYSEKLKKCPHCKNKALQKGENDK